MQGIVSYFENKQGYDFYFLYTIKVNMIRNQIYLQL